jgi:D-alanyl-D-alanine carboxypeptidase/D-alanyl-D-alanine-endopeptidase (penicillin-binding protein 4)
MRDLARQVAASGIKTVRGKVRIDIGMFHEGERELGTGYIVSPIVVNDNAIDTLVTPGAREGDPVTITISPQTKYLRILNQAKTGAPGSEETLDGNDNPDGDHVEMTVTGTVPAGAQPHFVGYPVPKPSIFAATLLREALEEHMYVYRTLPIPIPPASRKQSPSISLRP